MTGGATVQVHLLDVPVQVWGRTREHTAELMREFALLQVGEDTGTATRHVPSALLQLVADLRLRYGGTPEQDAQLDAALEGGVLTQDFVYDVPAEAVEACLALQAMFDAADDYCAQGRELMTLVSPVDQQAFRTWYLEEFIRQVRGQDPTPWAGPLT